MEHALMAAAVGTLLAVSANAQQVPPAQAETLVRESQNSHIAGNVPPKEDFDRLFGRDLTAYFCSAQSSDCTVQYEMLRNGPTQSGIAFPKFYVWVRVSGSNAVVQQGAARLAAIERERFEVTDFVGRAEIKRDPTQLQIIFPAALVSTIEEKAKAGR